MYQGETITTTIKDLPIPISEVENLYLIFANRSGIILEKTLKDFKIGENEIEVRLTQEETLKFPIGTIDRSLIVIAKDGSRFEYDPCEIRCGRTAKDEVLS